MTTMRLPTLPTHRRDLGDLSAQLSQRPEAAQTSGKDRPSFGESLREAAQKRPEHTPATAAVTDGVDDVDAPQHDAAGTDEPDETVQSQNQQETDQPVVIVSTSPDDVPSDQDLPVDSQHAAMEHASTSQSSATLTDRLADTLATQGAAAQTGAADQQSQAAIGAHSPDTDTDTKADTTAGQSSNQPTADTGPPVDGQQTAPTPVDSTIVATGETTQSSTRSQGADATINAVANDPATQTADEPSDRRRDSADQQSSNNALTRRQSTQVRPLNADAVDVPDDSMLQPSEQIAAGVRREITGETRETRRSSTRRPAASVRAHQVQTGLQVEQMTGVRANAQLPTAPIDPIAVISGAASSESGPLNVLNGESRVGDARMLPDPALDRVVSSRIVRGLSSMLQQRGGAMTMRLDPPELGQLRVQMSVARGVVNAQFMPGTARAQQLIERNMGTLRSALEGQGLSVDRLTVHAAASTSGQGATSTGQDASQHGHHTQSDADASHGESRGREHARQQHETPGTFASMVGSTGQGTTSFDHVAQGSTELRT